MEISEYQRVITLFYFFTFNDEVVALKVAKKTLEQVFNSKNGKVTDDRVVFHTFKNWKKYLKVRSRKKMNLSHETGWILNENVDLGLWRQFLRDSSYEEFLTILFVLILKFKDMDVAKGLGVSVGTVRHRINRGLRKMSEMRVGAREL